MSARLPIFDDTFLLILTGAGISADSGIPTFRAAGGLWNDHRVEDVASPDGFLRDPRLVWQFYSERRRDVLTAKPNAAHHALAAVEDRLGDRFLLVTQNVDGLHAAAGSRAVIELHGAIDRVRCLDCGAISARAAMQARVLAANPALADARAAAAPDGDAELHLDPATIAVPPCEACGGVLKPDVVFFGENVPRPVVDAAWALFDRAEALLVAGSSLAVFSGYRFVRRAAERGVPVAIANLGPTRGDDAAAIKIEARLGELLPRLAAAL